MGKAGNARVTVGSGIKLDKISLDINYTLDLLTQLQPLNRISLGARIDLGDQGRKALSDKVDALYLSGLDAYSRSDFTTAQNNWEEALKLDSRYEPAREGLNVLKKTLGIENRINDMQSLGF